MVLSMERWKGKVAVVTGASSGIGAEIVKALLNEGLIVVGMARRKKKIAELSKSKNVYSLKVDVTKEEEILDAFKWVADNLGPIHILINSVGVLWLTSSIKDRTEIWKNQFDVDLFGLVVPTREVVQQMIDNKIDGQIIHINGESGHGIYGKHVPAISACKTAIVSLTEALRRELISVNSKIKISSISPGIVNTDLFINNLSKQPEVSNIINQFETLPVLDSVDVASAVMYILSTPPHVQVHDIHIRAVGGV